MGILSVWTAASTSCCAPAHARMQTTLYSVYKDWGRQQEPARMQSDSAALRARL